MSSYESLDAEQIKQQVSGVFGRAAITYGQVGPAFFAHFGRRLVAHAQIPSGARVLDVATGRGAVLIPALEAVGAGGHVVGIDLAEPMLQETAKALAALKLPTNFELKRMDAEHLEFPEASFDCVLCGFAIFFFPQLDRAMSEFRRVLKPNGRLCVSTWDKMGDDRWRWFNEIVNRHLPPQPQPDSVPPAKAAPKPVFGTVDGLKAILEAAGFQNVQVAEEAAEFVYSSNEEYWSTVWSHGKRDVLEQMEKKQGKEGLQQFKKEVFSRLDTMQKDDGLHELFAALVGWGTKPAG